MYPNVGITAALILLVSINHVLLQVDASGNSSKDDAQLGIKELEVLRDIPKSSPSIDTEVLPPQKSLVESIDEVEETVQDTERHSKCPNCSEFRDLTAQLMRDVQDAVTNDNLDTISDLLEQYNKTANKLWVATVMPGGY